MKKNVFGPFILAVIAIILLPFTQLVSAQTPGVNLQEIIRQQNANSAAVKWETLKQQLDKQYYGIKVKEGSALEKLISENQDFSLLRPEESNDVRGLPPWLRVFWRKNHPEGVYSADDPTGGYPLVLKEILEWMMTHQDLKPGPGIEEKYENEDKDKNGLAPEAVSPDLRVSGLQTAPQSESDIRINYFDVQKIISASNNLVGSGQQGIYYSTNGGASWAQTILPLVASDSFHSDPTVDWTNDGRAYSSTIGINASASILILRNYYSTDNGATWTFDATFSGTQSSADKQLVWVDHSSTSPFFGRQYAIWHSGAPAFMNRRTAGAAGTWLATPIDVSTGDGASGTRIGSDVKTNSAGDVFGFYPATSNRGLYVVKSTNGGDNFSTAVRIGTTFDGYDIGIPSFNNRRALIYMSGGAYKTATKNLVYAAWTDLSGDAGCTAAANEPGSNAASTCKTRVWFSRSTDGGATWSAALKINNQSGLNDQFNQAMAVDETTGRIGVMYYDTIGDAGRRKTDVWFQFSSDDGLTWTTPEKVTTAMTDETISGADSGNQYGDYNSLSGFAGSFFPSWTDRRSNAKEEIWTAKITSFGPTAAPASINGKVMDKNRGIARAELTLVSSTGESRYTRTNSSGNYSFRDVPTGETYIISVKAKSRQFESQVITLLEDMENVDFRTILNAENKK